MQLTHARSPTPMKRDSFLFNGFAFFILLIVYTETFNNFSLELGSIKLTIEDEHTKKKWVTKT